VGAGAVRQATGQAPAREAPRADRRADDRGPARHRPL